MPGLTNRQSNNTHLFGCGNSIMRLSRCRWLLVLFCFVAWLSGPAPAQYQVYWGDVHGHTSHSDGRGNLDDYFVYARDISKLDFVIVTDHDFGNGTPTWRMPQETWTLTQDKADQHTVNGKFVAIAGYEWTSQPKYWMDVAENVVSEHLFSGSPKFYNHKTVYFPSRVKHLFSAKDDAYNNPDLLAAAVLHAGGLNCCGQQVWVVIGVIFCAEKMFHP